MTAFNGNSLSYDANGNLTSDGTYTYTWDARNHLTQISQKRTTVATFQYDAFGRRVEKTVNGVTTQYLYDGLNPVEELDGSSPANVTATMLTGLGIDQYFARTDSNGTVSYLTNRLGSTIAIANSSSALTTQYSYEPFGATTVSGSSTNPFQFTGRENDGTGLYYYRGRYYSPTYGRFISQDPLGFGGGDPNLYGYVMDDPINGRDPSGRAWVGAAVGAVWGGFEGYEAARLQGQSGGELITSTIIGAVLGGGVGAINPLDLSYGEMVLLGGDAAGTGDVIGQLQNNGWNFRDLNPGEIVGSALGGAGAAALGVWGDGVVRNGFWNEWFKNLLGTGPGTFGSPIGSLLGDLLFGPPHSPCPPSS